MKEAKSNTELNQYLREMRKQGFYCYYELKVARGGTFAFSKIEKHQDEGLPVLENEGLTWKFSDEDSRRKPCDGGSFPPLPAFLIIKFGGSYCFMRYEKITEMMAAGRKSITAAEAVEGAEKVMHTRH